MIEIFICFIYLESIKLFINNSIYWSNSFNCKLFDFPKDIKIYFILIERAFWDESGILFKANKSNILFNLFMITKSNFFNFSSASFIL